MIDLAVVGALMGSVYIGSVFVQLLFDPQSFSFQTPAVFMSVSVLVIISIAYLTTCWATTGRTVGAILMGVRLVSPRHGVLLAAGSALCVVRVRAVVGGRRPQEKIVAGHRAPDISGV